MNPDILIFAIPFVALVMWIVFSWVDSAPAQEQAPDPRDWGFDIY